MVPLRLGAPRGRRAGDRLRAWAGDRLVAAEVGVLEAGEACERRRALEAGEAGERRRALEAGDRLRAVVAADMQIVLPRVVIAIGMGWMGEKNARNAVNLTTGFTAVIVPLPRAVTMVCTFERPALVYTLYARRAPCFMLGPRSRPFGCGACHVLCL